MTQDVKNNINVPICRICILQLIFIFVFVQQKNYSLHSEMFVFTVLWNHPVRRNKVCIIKSERFTPHHWRLLQNYHTLDCTKRYSPLRRLTSSYCGGLRPGFFLPFKQTKRAFQAVCAYFRQFLVFSSNLRNF